MDVVVKYFVLSENHFERYFLKLYVDAQNFDIQN